ncbi:sterol desaturase family protein [Flammeovirga agarivorans]|uniref:Sterol desaturase family protein n=1 Tax=Flammeovirga agarivorans TaxID=2726742 RepID=A0A7X8XY14_9BACT|nr:sterol desaturase family protein [Flammeovirga agarivorans]NLR93796.1 sterol desaturase family protein [Flammeovirga agarivorans]
MGAIWDSVADFSTNLKGKSAIFVYSIIFIEWFFLWRIQVIKKHKETLVNIFSYVIESLPYLLLGPIVILGIMNFTYEHRIFTLGTEWYVWLAAFLLLDFGRWFIHFLGHKIRILWCIHGVHHTPKEMSFSVTVRGSFLGILLSPHSFIWLPILGFNPFLVLIVDTICRVYVVLEHGNEKVIGKQRWMELFFISPSAHRVHHSKNPIYLDRNFGETFSIWDRIFNTFQTELDHEKPELGIMNDKLDPSNLKSVQLTLWKDLWKDVKGAPTFIDKIKYILYPPGWNHIDGGKLAGEFRKEALDELKTEEQKTTEQVV